MIQISEVHEHPQYNSDSYDYDITVLRLASSLSFGSAVQPIALPQQGQAFVPGKISRVTGWGATTENGSPASQLQVVEIPLMTTEQCRNSYGVENVTERMFCAGYPEGGKDACQVIKKSTCSFASFSFILTVYFRAILVGPSRLMVFFWA